MNKNILSLIASTLLLTSTLYADEELWHFVSLQGNLSSEIYDLEELSQKHSNIKGWGHLFNRLVDRGINPEKLAAIFRHPKMPQYSPIHFNLNPRESSAPYARMNTAPNRNNALQFYRTHKEIFLQAEAKFNVNREIILALIQMESGCGRYTGNSPVFYRLARLASATSPQVLDKVYRDHKKNNPKITREQVEARALWLEQTFLPQVAGAIVIAEKMGLHTHELKGSVSGAIGLPQFLPANVLKYGVDADQNGKVDIFKPADAIHSVAKYLAARQWNIEQLDTPSNRNVIRAYNNSDPYIDTAFLIAKTLKPNL